MRVRVFLGRAAICAALVAVATTAADGQYIYPYTPSLGSGSYLFPGPYYYSDFYGHYPNVYPYTQPQPPIGSYLPNQARPPLPFTSPPTGLVPQPYPYYYQSPPYTLWPYLPPYYPPSLVRPRYYRYGGPTYSPQSHRPRADRYGAPARRQQRVAPVGQEAPW